MKIRMIFLCLVLFCTTTTSVLAAGMTEGSGNLNIEWKEVQGKKLISEVFADEETFHYSYNDDLNRITKSTSELIFDFVYNDDNQLIKETRNKELSIHYYYEESMTPTSFSLNGEKYYLITDEDFNVTSIIDENNSTVAIYQYDKLGGILSILGYDKEGDLWLDKQDDPSFIGVINKIRLHSLYYDDESRLYYNGLNYYDYKTNQYITASLTDFSLDVIEENTNYSTQSVSSASAAATQLASTLLSDPNYGKSISYSSNWYSSLSDVELLARLIYGENTFISNDRNAVAWVIVNRKNDSSSTFSSTLRGVAVQSGQFAAITGTSSNTSQARTPSTSSSAWASATWIASSLVVTSVTSEYEALFPKPTGISNQLYYVALSYFLLNGNGADTVPAGNGLRYSFNGGSTYNKIKDVAIVFDSSSGYSNILNPTSKSVLTSSPLNTTTERNKHNIFFNLD